jgi:calcium permeable stress-gated cation channel
MANFIIKRQQHLINPVHSKSVQANTLLVTGVPAKYLTQDALHKLFDELPGGVKRIFINRDLKELPDIYDRRLAACNKLESAETKLLSIATKSGKDASAEESAGGVPRDKRPTHKLGFLGLFGQKVDSIDWAREEIHTCTKLLDEGRAKIADHSDATYPPLSSAFITFHKQVSAHLGKQILLHHEPYRMTGRHIEVSPEDVIWSNLGMNPYEMKVCSFSLSDLTPLNSLPGPHPYFVCCHGRPYHLLGIPRGIRWYRLQCLYALLNCDLVGLDL